MAETAPEIQRCELTTLIMTIKALGVKNILSFDLMSVPTVEALSHGLETLHALGALDESAELTAIGAEMVYFPTDVRTSRMLLASLDMEDREDTPSMVSKLIVGDVLTVAAGFGGGGSRWFGAKRGRSVRVHMTPTSGAMRYSGAWPPGTSRTRQGSGPAVGTTAFALAMRCS